MAQLSEMTIKFPYRRSLGPVIGAFMTGLTEQRIIGIRNGGSVLVPPLEWDPATGKELKHDFVDVGPAGSVTSWSWVAKPGAQHPLDKPFAFALIQLDGADTSIMHVVDAGSLDAMSTGMRSRRGGAPSARATSPTSRHSSPVRVRRPMTMAGLPTQPSRSR